MDQCWIQSHEGLLFVEHDIARAPFSFRQVSLLLLPGVGGSNTL